MYGVRELDIKNTYNPNLNDIKESAERTYGEAECFYRKEELYLKDIEKRLESGELHKEEDIYDECNSIASDLAKCSEMYLKALYIFENNIENNSIEEIWTKLKNTEFKTDKNGNTIYKTYNGIITYPKYDNNGNLEYDQHGKPIYIDDNGNIYGENNRGSKIKMNGHQLDRLINLLSPDSRLLLETRMLTIPMDYTEKYPKVSILDLLQEKGFITKNKLITEEDYNGWIDQHKKTFEQARYSGEKSFQINIEFLYHLTTQIKAVAQYKMKPITNQKFDITDEEIQKLPNEIKQLSKINSKLLSENLIKLIIKKPVLETKINELINNDLIRKIINLKENIFCEMLEKLDYEEIEYIIWISYTTNNYIELKAYCTKEKNENIQNVLSVASMLYINKFTINEIAELCLILKTSLSKKINNNLLKVVFETLQSYDKGSIDLKFNKVK